MFICTDCGLVFEEVGSYSENHASYGDAPAVEEWSCCPCCEGCFEEAEQCKICGEFFLQKNVHGGVCNSCIAEHSDIETCMQASNVKEAVELDLFLLSMFSVDQIEHILQEQLRGCATVDMSPFIDGDRDWFGERLVEMGVK